MGLIKARQLSAANRLLLFVIPLSVLLVASVVWNVWQYRPEHEQRAQAAERASQAVEALAKERAQRTGLRRQASTAQSNARVQQLYDEINYLTQVGEQVLLPSPKIQTTPTETGRKDKTADHP